MLYEPEKKLSELLVIESDVSDGIASTFFGNPMDDSSANEFDESASIEKQDKAVEFGQGVTFSNNSESYF